MRVQFLLFLLFTGSVPVFSQNLVLNPGLEELDTTREILSPADSFMVHHVVGWYNPGATTTDFFNSDGAHFNCGSRYFSRQVKAHSGSCYGGFYVDNTRWKEYIGIALKEPLKKGQNYRVEMYLAISNRSKYGAASLQIDFWDTNYVQIGGVIHTPRMSPIYPPVTIRNTGQQAMVGNWVKVSADFTALGGERSFVLGYLADLFQTAPLPETNFNRQNDYYVYYYIDDVSLFPIEGPPIVTKMPSRPIIYFDVDKDVIKPDFFPALNDVVDRMKKDATLKVELDGFTDSTASSEYNMDLSLRRAQAVADYLIAHGISPSRLTTKGFAELRPAGENAALNRRVEFVYSH